VCVNFDYCEACEEVNANIHNHPFVKYRVPQQMKHCGFGGEKRGFFKKQMKNFFDCLTEFQEGKGKNGCKMTECKPTCEKTVTVQPKKETKEEKKDEIDIMGSVCTSVIQDKGTTTTTDVNNDYGYGLMADEIAANFQLKIGRERIIEVLMINCGDYDKTVSDLFTEQSIFFKN